MSAILATVHGSADRFGAVVVKNKVRMAAGVAEPAFDAPVRLRNRGAYRALRGGAVSISRGSGDMPFPLQTLAQFVVRLANMFAEDMSAGSFVLAEVAYGIAGRVGLSRRSDRAPAIPIGGLAGDQTAQAEGENDADYNAASSKQSKHSTPDSGLEHRYPCKVL
jgi:hypothetical protein